MSGFEEPSWPGKRYWLIGASEGLGRALAAIMSRSGVELVLSSRNQARLTELAAELPGKAQVVPCDVTDRASVAAAAGAAGEVDGLVWLAGHYAPVRATHWDAEAVDEMVAVNLAGALRVLGAVLPGFVARGAGHVVLTGSLAGFRGLPGTVGYGAAKAGLISLAQTLHADLKDTGVRVQLVNPGTIRRQQALDGEPPRPGTAITPEAAAQEMWEHMGTGDFQKAFPLGSAAAARAGSMLPTWAYERLFR
jgi:NADP-dependent 3-hydroxy acid dehydrogenase YdfG